MWFCTSSDCATLIHWSAALSSVPTARSAPNATAVLTSGLSVAAVPPALMARCSESTSGLVSQTTATGITPCSRRIAIQAISKTPDARQISRSRRPTSDGLSLKGRGDTAGGTGRRLRGVPGYSSAEAKLFELHARVFAGSQENALRQARDALER